MLRRNKKAYCAQMILESFSISGWNPLIVDKLFNPLVGSNFCVVGGSHDGSNHVGHISFAYGNSDSGSGTLSGIGVCCQYHK